mmetsp:Transcript_84274/g.252753  ORF Transcript_84274/g.252753 Transcript_84274/m.252753 type:complete len:449 (+) Transcript_84274:89-1435(+)
MWLWQHVGVCDIVGVCGLRPRTMPYASSCDLCLLCLLLAARWAARCGRSGCGGAVHPSGTRTLPLGGYLSLVKLPHRPQLLVRPRDHLGGELARDGAAQLGQWSLRKLLLLLLPHHLLLEQLVPGRAGARGPLVFIGHVLQQHALRVVADHLVVVQRILLRLRLDIRREHRALAAAQPAAALLVGRVLFVLVHPHVADLLARVQPRRLHERTRLDLQAQHPPRKVDAPLERRDGHRRREGVAHHRDEQVEQQDHRHDDVEEVEEDEEEKVDGLCGRQLRELRAVEVEDNRVACEAERHERVERVERLVELHHHRERLRPRLRVRDIHGDAIVEQEDDKEEDEEGHVGREHLEDRQVDDAQLLVRRERRARKVLHVDEERKRHRHPQRIKVLAVSQVLVRPIRVVFGGDHEAARQREHEPTEARNHLVRVHPLEQVHNLGGVGVAILAR